jgi:hypothetical protein
MRAGAVFPAVAVEAAGDAPSPELALEAEAGTRRRLELIPPGDSVDRLPAAAES